MKKTILITTALCSFGTVATAATVSVDYDFSGATSAPTTVTGDLSGSTLTSGTFTGGSSVATFSTFSSTVFARVSATGATTADGDTIGEAIGNDAYASFTITAGAEAITLDTIVWAHFGTNTDYASSDMRVYAFQESAGFTSGDEIGFTSTAGSEVAGDTADFSSGSLALTGTIAAGSTEEFRFYFVDNASSSARIAKLNSFTITGSTVPEPSSSLLLGLAGLGFILRRRK